MATPGQKSVEELRTNGGIKALVGPDQPAAGEERYVLAQESCPEVCYPSTVLETAQFS